jgi:hypothetical protein
MCPWSVYMESLLSGTRGSCGVMAIYIHVMPRRGGRVVGPVREQDMVAGLMKCPWHRRGYLQVFCPR